MKNTSVWVQVDIQKSLPLDAEFHWRENFEMFSKVAELFWRISTSRCPDCKSRVSEEQHCQGLKTWVVCIRWLLRMDLEILHSDLVFSQVNRFDLSGGSGREKGDHSDAFGESRLPHINRGSIKRVHNIGACGQFDLPGSILFMWKTGKSLGLAREMSCNAYTLVFTNWPWHRTIVISRYRWHVEV